MEINQEQFKAPFVRLFRRVHLSAGVESLAHLLPQRFVHTRVYEFLHRVWKECRIDDAVDMAAQVSFYFALSCFPFLLVLAALLGWFPHSPNWQSFWIWLTNYLPPTAQVTVLTIMLNLSKGAKRFLSFGLLLTIWSASSGFMSLMNALSYVYGGPETRSYFQRRALAIVATLLAAAFLVACFGLWNVGHIMQGLLLRYSFHYSTPWTLARWALTLLMILIGVDLINYFFPARRPPWRWITPGSALTVICFVAASGVLKLYVTYNHSISRIYGTLTGFIVMMLWIYLGNLSILLGAQTDAVLLQLKSEQHHASAHS